MTGFAIYQEPGAQAHARRDYWRRQGYSPSTPRPKRVATIDGTTSRRALVTYLTDRYPSGHAQYRGHQMEWRATGRGWKADDGNYDRRGREWSALVTLQNGAYVHTVRLLAWRQA